MKIKNEESCEFCNSFAVDAVLENEYDFFIRDEYSVSETTYSFISERHNTDYLKLTSEKKIACDQLLADARELLKNKDNSVSVLDIGMNCGKYGVQTIFHPPRFISSEAIIS